jgi:hypothetical protein
MTRRLLEYGDDLNDVLRSALDAEKSSPIGADADAARLAKIGAGIAERIGAPPPQPPSNPPPGNAAPVATGVASKAPFILLAAATIIGLVAIGSMSNDKPAPAAPPQAKTVETAATPIAEPPPSTPGVSLNDLPSVPSKTTTAKPAARPTTNAEAPTQEEIALIDRAHQTLRTDPQGALALCKEHETKFASGHFAQEREAVAIEALVQMNRKDEAKRRFSSFDNQYPSSSHRVHLESLLAR